MRKDIISWDETWMQFADTISQRSKDPNTQVGAVLVSPDQRKHAVGYNGFPNGIKETEERWSRPTKYNYVIHAETNAILNSKTDLTGWTLYVTTIPCHNCAKVVIQAGIKKIIYRFPPSLQSELEYSLSIELFKEADVVLIQLPT